MLKKISVGFGIFAAILVFVGFLLPSKGHVERSIVIKAPVSDVFDIVNNIREFNKWSPWAKIDPKTHYEFEGPHFGVGAMMLWKSDHPQVGSGRQEIINSEKNSEVTTQLDFGSKGTAKAHLKLRKVEGGTGVTWGFDTEFGYNLLARYFGLMFDSRIGPDFEKGLAGLKSLIENKPRLQNTE